MNLTNVSQPAAVSVGTSRLDVPLDYRCNEAELRRLLALLPLAMYFCDRQGNISYFNKLTASLWGSEPVPQNPRLRFCGGRRLFRRDGSNLPLEESPVALVLQTGKPLRDFEFVIERPDASRLLVRANVDPVLDDANLLCGAVAFLEDITQSVKAEERRAIQYAVSRILSETQEPKEALARILNSICEIGHWTVGAIYSVDAVAKVLRCTDFYNQAPDRIREFEKMTHASVFPLGVGLPGRAWAKRGLAWIAEIPKDKNFPRHEAARRDGLLSGFAFPLIVDDSVIGAIEFIGSEVQEAELDFLHLMQGVAGQLGQFMQRKSIERTLLDHQERLRAALDASMTGTFCWDIKSNRVDFDESLCRLFGFSSTQKVATLSDFFELVHPDDRPDVIAACERCAKEGADFSMDFRVPWPDGSIHWLLDKGKTFFDKSGRPAYATGACADITDRKLREGRTRSYSQTLEGIIQGRPLREIFEMLTSAIEHHVGRDLVATILLTTADGGFLRPFAHKKCPPGWLRFIDPVPFDENIGSCGAAAALKQRIIASDLEKDPRWQNYKTEALRYGLRACWSTPILSSRNEVLGTFAIYYHEPGLPSDHELQIVEVAARTAAIAIERQKSQEALLQAQEQLRLYTGHLEQKVAERTAQLSETISELEHLSHSIVHDMRAPLRALSGFSSVLRDEHGPELSSQAHELLEKIRVAAERQDQFIQDVLAYISLMRGDYPLVPIKLEPFIQEIIKTWPNLQPPRLNIEIPRPLRAVLGHPTLLTQAFTNLLDNAAKFVPKGAAAKVQIRTETRGDKVKIWIKDNGIGIAQEFHGRIFNMFQRLHSHHDYEGTGIGLSIVRKAVERMNGQVGLESLPGHGSSFWILLSKPQNLDHNS